MKMVGFAVGGAKSVDGAAGASSQVTDRVDGVLVRAYDSAGRHWLIGRAAEGTAVKAHKYRIAAICALALVAVAAAGIGAAYVALRQVRPFYEQALALDPVTLKEGGRELETRASALYSDAHKPGQWRAVFTADQINGWMATQLTDDHGHTLPKGIELPRVAIGSDTFTLGFRAQHGGIATVVSADASALVTESGQIAIRLLSVQAGSLPVPVLQVADQISKACQSLSLPVRWTEEEGEPVALLDLRGGGSEKHELFVDAIELRDGSLYVAGHTEDTAASAGAVGRHTEIGNADLR